MSSVRVGQDQFELIDEGRGDPVVLLHGFPTSRLLWQRVVPRLAARFRVLAPDLLGYGKSSGGGPVDLASQADAVLRLLDVLDLPRVALVAHDVGTAAAQILAVRAPDRLRALVLIDGVHAGAWAMEAVESIRTWDPAKAASLAKVLARTMRVKDPALREIVASYEGEEGGRRLIRAAQAFDPRQTESIGEKLRDLAMPSLVVWGEHDEYLPLREVGEPLAKSLRARLVVLPGGHFLPLDAPEELTATLLSFLT
jgi:pimeloyl-ACP methyl ester carboxylesterase